MVRLSRTSGCGVPAGMRDVSKNRLQSGGVVTLKHLAEEAGVSVAVVSAVINGSRYVRMSPETRARVEKVIAESGYVPNHAARSLRLSRSKILGVILPQVANPITIDMLEGIYAAAQSLGWVVLLGDASRVASGSLLLERIMGEGLVDGTLVRPSFQIEPDFLHKLSSRKRPIVVLDESVDDFAWVGIDETAGVRLAAEHLLAHGHTEIGFLGGMPGYPATERRLLGLTSALGDAGIRTDPAWIVLGGQFPEEGFALAREFFARPGPRPTAMVVNNVTTAQGVVAAAADAGIRIPEDLSVVAFHDMPDADLLRPALTTIKMPMYDLGYQGVLVFKDLLDAKSVASRVLPAPPELVGRASVAHRR